MTITYKSVPEFGTNKTIKVPVLHRVVYDQRIHESIPAVYQRSYKDHLVCAWLEENCKHPYYHSGGWHKEKFIEFECDQEAILFALRWQ